MIEIRISIETAVVLLKERVDYEFDRRIKIGEIPKGLSLVNLNFKELLNVVESSTFDLICLLPVELLLDQTNLSDIITKTIHSLAEVYNKEEFKIYSKRRAESLTNPIIGLLKQSQKTKDFMNN